MNEKEQAFFHRDFSIELLNMLIRLLESMRINKDGTPHKTDMQRIQDIADLVPEFISHCNNGTA